MKKKKGFVLIEIIFYIALLAFLSFAVFAVIDILNKERINNVAFSEVNYQGFLVANYISNEIRGAEKVIVDENNFEIYKEGKSIPVKINLVNGGLEIDRDNSIEKLNNEKVVVSNFVVANNSSNEKYYSIIFSFDVAYDNKLDINYKYSKKFYGAVSKR